MKKRIYAFLDNDSAFGRIMQKCWLIIGSNLMFMIFSLPVITIGPAFAALYHVHLKSMRGHDDLNPVTEFWKGFRNNFRQAVICWIIFLIIAFIALADIRFLTGMGGQNEMMVYFRYVVFFIVGVILAVGCMVFPVMAAFSDTLRGLMRSAFYFAAKNPARAVFIVVLNIVPYALSYIDVQRMPLYGFLWVICGFSVIARCISALLIRDFNRFLPPVDTGIEEY